MQSNNALHANYVAGALTIEFATLLSWRVSAAVAFSPGIDVRLTDILTEPLFFSRKLNLYQSLSRKRFAPGIECLSQKLTREGSGHCSFTY
jgi:hypothetical protein